MNAPEVEKAAEELLRDRLDHFRPALIRPSPKWLDEDYLVIDIESAQHPDGRSATAAEMLQSMPIRSHKSFAAKSVRFRLAERDEIVRSACLTIPATWSWWAGRRRLCMTNPTPRPP